MSNSSVFIVKRPKPVRKWCFCPEDITRVLLPSHLESSLFNVNRSELYFFYKCAKLTAVMTTFFEHQRSSYKKGYMRNLISLASTDGTLDEIERDLIHKIGKTKGLKDWQINDLLEQLGRRDEARDEFARAAALTGNAREREALLARAAACASA